MTETKLIDGCLPCKCGDNCPFYKACGSDWDWKQPNTKKLACLCKHIEELAKELYEVDGQNAKATLGDYAYQLFWLMHNEIKDTIHLLCNWGEPNNGKQNFIKCFNLFCRCYKDYKLAFLAEGYERLRMTMKCFENSFE